ncbi:MAG: peptidoglycan DD-metalloendopeptidase family protein [Chloroflexota bacterium]|nr:peptidoglycan DD-metalloendopeptidase family protein [Chloroflexota bacterium]
MNSARHSAILLALVCLHLWLGLRVHSADIFIGKTCNLADAITAANHDLPVGGCVAGSAADVIHLSSNIALKQELPWITSEIIIEGAGFNISGMERFRHFNIDGGRLTIRNLALTDGHNAAWGGSILLRSGGLIINDCRISDNSAASNGVLTILSGEASISGSVFRGNEGGVIDNNGSVTISRSSFSRNVGSSGGAITNRGRLLLTGSAIKENHATVLGGAIFNSGVLTIDDSKITDNGNSGILSAGPIYQVSGELAITDSIIALNKATDNDSAVFVVRGQASLRDNVIYGNGRYAGWAGPPRPPLAPLWQQDLGPGRRGSCGKVEGGGAYWLHPLPQATISRGFRQGLHGGVDLVAPFGTPIRAANGGPISYAGWRGPYGITVEIQHNYRSTLYAHLAALTVRCGETVAPGQVIGFVGSSGNSSGPHLHFELRVWGRKQDPMLIEAIGW